LRSGVFRSLERRDFKPIRIENNYVISQRLSIFFRRVIAFYESKLRRRRRRRLVDRLALQSLRYTRPPD